MLASRSAVTATIHILEIATLIGGTAVLTNICSGLENQSLVRNAQNCSEYYRCNDGMPALDFCPSGKRFDHISGRCDDPANVKCFECPIGVLYADVPVPNACQQFVRCYNGWPQQLTCADGLAFDQKYAMCNLYEYVECAFTMECPTNTGELTVVRDPENCASYYVCVASVPLILVCPKPLHFNMDTLQCDLPERSGCQRPELLPQQDLLKCPQVGGPLFAVPSNTTLSYWCNEHHTAIVHQCRPGLVFNYTLQGCIATAC